MNKPEKLEPGKHKINALCWGCEESALVVDVQDELTDWGTYINWVECPNCGFTDLDSTFYTMKEVMKVYDDPCIKENSN